MVEIEGNMITNLILSAIEAMPAALLARHVFLCLADLAGQRAHAFGWLGMSKFKLDCCKEYASR